jgi:hypothetical protein
MSGSVEVAGDQLRAIVERIEHPPAQEVAGLATPGPAETARTPERAKSDPIG